MTRYEQRQVTTDVHLFQLLVDAFLDPPSPLPRPALYPARPLVFVIIFVLPAQKMAQL
jgi:hypothetical protein